MDDDHGERMTRARQALGGVPVIREDNHLLVLHKPAGLLTQPAEQGDDSLLERAREYLRIAGEKPGKAYVGLVHRLDRNVSGVVVLARTSKAASRLSDAFRRRTVDKVYLAVVEGRAPGQGELSDRLGRVEGERRTVRTADGKDARLRFRRLNQRGEHSLLEVELLTGRRHRIRAQLARAGMPITGDPLYGEASSLIRRPALHAYSMALTHPVTKEALQCVADVPPDLVELLDRLQLRANVSVS